AGSARTGAKARAGGARRRRSRSRRSTGTARRTWACSGSPARPATEAGAEAAAEAAKTTAAADIHAPKVALAHGRVPGGLDLAGINTAQDSDVVHDVGVRSAG